MFGHWKLKARKPAARATTMVRIQKRRDDRADADDPRRALLRAAVRSARARAAGGNEGPRSMLFIWRWY